MVYHNDNSKRHKWMGCYSRNMAEEGYYAVDGDSNDVTVEATAEKGAIHISGIKEQAGLETVMMTGNYPTRMVLEHVEGNDVIERHELGTDDPAEIGLYIDHLGEFIEHCCASDWSTTIAESVRDRVMEVSQ